MIKRVKNIAVLMDGFDTWGGGLRYAELMISSIDSVSDINVYIIIQPDHVRATRHVISYLYRCIKKFEFSFLKFRQSTKIINSDLIKKQLQESCVNKINFISYNGSLINLKKVTIKNKIDIIFPTCKVLPANNFNSIISIFDFQHKYLPHFFSESEINAREKHIKNVLINCNKIVVNAKAVAADINFFYRKSFKSVNVYALPFAPSLSNSQVTYAYESLDKILNIYNICNNNYFIICNQFWMHKGHHIAFEAFAKFRNSNLKFRDWKLVCTGSNNDYRDDAYVKNLFSFAANLNIDKNIVSTGFVDRLEQLALVAGSSALIQPTTFEGGPGGGAVYDAVSLGVPCLVSDIKVNKEIGSGDIKFFEVNNSDSLSKIMIEMSLSKKTISISKILDNNLKNRKFLGSFLMNMINKN